MSTTTPKPESNTDCAHVFTKVDGVFTCDCGERRTGHGKPIQPRHLSVVGK